MSCNITKIPTIQKYKDANDFNGLTFLSNLTEISTFAGICSLLAYHLQNFNAKYIVLLF